MTFNDIHSRVGAVPYITAENARFLYDLILRERIGSILELGIAHGTATCVMAAALQELGAGRITAVDLIDTKDVFQPTPEAQLHDTGLTAFADVVRMQSGYTWFLHDAIVKNTVDDVCVPVYDLVVIDGPKNWTIDGAAFFMADKLLKPGGWMIFDDVYWTYAEADTRRDSTDGISHRSLSLEERRTPHIRDVVDYLVKQHPDYGDITLLEDADWVVARKSAASRKTYTVVNRDTTRVLLRKLLSKLYRALR